MIVVFILSALWWIRIRGLWKLPDGRDWLWEIGSCSDGWVHAQYIFNPIFCWWEGLCSLPVVWPEAKLSTTPPPEIPGHSQASLSQSLVGTLLLAPAAHKVLFLPSKNLFPQSRGSSVIKSHWPPKSNFLGILSSFAGSRVGGKSVVGPWTFLTVREFHWYNCSAVCGSFAWWFYGAQPLMLKKLKLNGSMMTYKTL